MSRRIVDDEEEESELSDLPDMSEGEDEEDVSMEGEDDEVEEEDEIDDEEDYDDDDDEEEEEAPVKVTTTASRRGGRRAEPQRPAPKLVIKLDKPRAPARPRRGAKPRAVAEVDAGFYEEESTPAVEEVEDEEEEEDEEAEEEEELEEEEIEEEVDDELEDEEDGTPDITKMTARQRSRFIEEAPDELVELPQEPMRKKVLTAEEQQLKRAELARRRKNLSERRLEEEKQDTLDKLLKKRAPKARRILNDEGIDIGEESESGAPKRPRLAGQHPAVSSWHSSKDRLTLSIPREWESVSL